MADNNRENESKKLQKSLEDGHKVLDKSRALIKDLNAQIEMSAKAREDLKKNREADQKDNSH